MTPTPLIKLDNVYLKREDQNLTGSAKDRALSEQLKNLSSQKISKAVISSTGNAAISAIYYCGQYGISLTIFLSPKVDRHKLDIINKNGGKVIQSDQPITEAFRFSKTENAFFLRQSTDPVAIKGYSAIGNELMEQLPEISSLFVPVGSGTTLLGISKCLKSNIPVYAVQPSGNCPISKFFDQDYAPENEVITDALTVKMLPLKTAVINAVRQSGGSGLIISSQQTLDASNILTANGIHTSLEGALAFAGYQKALQQKLYTGSHPVILLTGSKR